MRHAFIPIAGLVLGHPEIERRCDHGGRVAVVTSQNLVRIDDRLVLVDPDTQRRSISGCPNTNPAIGMKACLTTLQVMTGHSRLVRIDGQRACLDSIRGLTDGTPPGTVRYKVHVAGQELVSSGEFV